MKKISLKNTMVSMTKVIISVVVAVVLSVGIVMAITYDYSGQQRQEVVYDVIAENDTQYVLRDCENADHYETIAKSEMFGIGETVICTYADKQVTSVWLYVDC